MTWWDACKEQLPSLNEHEPLVIGLDAATGSQYAQSDCFALVGITRHPNPQRSDTDLAIRFTHTWRVRPGQKIDYRGTPEEPGPERILLNYCGYDLDEHDHIIYHGRRYSVQAVVYDPKQLHDMAQRLGSKESITWFREMGQNKERCEADRQLYDLIRRRGISHDGNAELRNHVRSADRKVNPLSRQFRIVKKSESQPIDLVVCSSMASYVALELNL